jgi:hypothetical protein
MQVLRQRVRQEESNFAWSLHIRPHGSRATCGFPLVTGYTEVRTLKHVSHEETNGPLSLPPPPTLPVFLCGPSAQIISQDYSRQTLQDILRAGRGNVR